MIKFAVMVEQPNPEFTVDELARASAVPVSTIRMYQHRGLLDPPVKRGRVGFYGQPHLERLGLIGRLQERGFSLAAIKEAVDSWSSGQSLPDLLGLSPLGRSMAPEEVRLGPAELARRFEGVPLAQEDIQRAEAIGLIRMDGADVVVRSVAFAEIGPAVAQLGIPISAILDEYEALQASVGEIADRFRAVFERYFWAEFADRGMPENEIPDLTDAAARMARLATGSVTAELNVRFTEFIEGYVSRASEVARLRAGTPATDPTEKFAPKS